jgi:hypothetical protein
LTETKILKTINFYTFLIVGFDILPGREDASGNSVEDGDLEHGVLINNNLSCGFFSVQFAS